MWVKNILMSFLISLVIGSSFAAAAATLMDDNDGSASQASQDTGNTAISDSGNIDEAIQLNTAVRGGADKTREGRKAREILNIRVNTPPQVKVIKIHPTKYAGSEPLVIETKGSEEKQVIINAQKVTTEALKETQCQYARTENLPSATFDCTEGIAYLDNKETPLVAGHGKDHASIETTFEIPELHKKTVLRLVHDTKFPTQQDASVYYLDQQTDTWKLACHSLKEGTNYCDVTPAAKAKKATFKVEGYSREGTALWSVNSISVFQAEEAEQNIPSLPANPGAANVIIPISSPFCRGQVCNGILVPQSPCVGTACTSSPPSPVPPTVTLAVGSPLAKTPAQPRTAVSTSSNPEQQSTQTESTFPASQQNQPEPAPVTGAAIGNFLTKNKAGLGLLLLFLIVVGTMAYRSSRARRRLR